MILVPLVMSIWWFIFRPPSLWLLRELAYVPLAVCVAPAGTDPVAEGAVAGEWTFNVALEKAGKQSKSGKFLSIHTVSFEAEIEQLTIFVTGWPCYLALAFSAGGRLRSQIGRILKGASLQTGINILALGAWAYSSAYLSTPLENDSLVWVFRYIQYLCTITPWVSPFAVALLFHPEWRNCFDPTTRDTHEA